MKKFFKMFLCAAMIFSFSSANVSAAVIDISDDNILSFISKCNRELKKNDPNNNLDTPALSETFRIYTETLKVNENFQVKFLYTTKDDKVCSIRLEPDKYDSEVKDFFEGMSIVYLKALGLTDEEIRKPTKESGDKTEWRKEYFVPTLNKRFIVFLKNSKLTIVASDKQNTEE